MNPLYLHTFRFGIFGKTAFTAFSILLLSLLMLSGVVQAQVTSLGASVDRNNILLDESLQLSIVAGGSAPGDAIDFNSLQSDFSVGQPSFSQSTQIINGAMSRTVTWTVNLFPKQVGSFTIPSFSVDGVSSKQFLVKVLPVDTANSDQPREFFVSANIDNSSVYLQQQILYTVKIHLARDIQRGQLTPPELAGAIVEQIGEDEDYQEIIDGVRYRIIERKYAIIPQSSGNFVISGPLFEAEVPTNSRRSFANFGRSKTIARRAPEINIAVRPIPDNYNHTWLPSELVEVAEQWQGDIAPFIVGEPVTRTITLTALGLTKEQLPSAEMPYHPSFKVYPEQPTLATVEHNNKLIAQGVFNSAIIPEQAGTFVIPEASIAWFNVNTGETEFATLPARSIEVVTAPSGSSAAGQAPPPQALDSGPETAALEQALPTEIAIPSTLNTWHYVLIATNLLSLIAFYVFWLMKKGQTNAPTLSHVVLSTPAVSEHEAFKYLTESLEKNDPTALPHALENWLRSLCTEQFYSVSASLAVYPQTLALESYNQVLASHFSPDGANINYREFSERLTQYRKLAKKDDKQSALSVLYPK